MPIKDNVFVRVMMPLMLAIFLAPVLSGCGKKVPELPPELPVVQPPPAPEPITPADASEEGEEKPVYLYTGDRFRDPFAEVGQTMSYQADAIFNPQQARLSAVLLGSRTRGAVISVPGSGSYYIIGGRIIDVMGKPVSGYRAVVSIDKVVISGEADDVYELRLREQEAL